MTSASASQPASPTSQPDPRQSALRPTPQTVWLTGAGGFIGRALSARLRADAGVTLLAPRRAELDLEDAAAVDAFLAERRPDVVVHLAAATAGSGAMRAAPSRFLMANLRAAAPLLAAVEGGRVPRLIVAGSAGEYPRLAAVEGTPRALTPSDLWRGPPAAGGYGMARRTISQLALDGAAKAGTEAAVLVLPTVFGPGDGARPHAEGPTDASQLRALPAFAVRMLRALAEGRGSVAHFGSGYEVRDFLHVDDAARAFAAALRAPISGQRVHVSSGVAVTMADLAGALAAEVGYAGTHEWLHRQPGQTQSDDRVWLAPAGLDALGFAPSADWRSALPAVLTDLRARFGV